jgi:hypothetical protein
LPILLKDVLLGDKSPSNSLDQVIQSSGAILLCLPYAVRLRQCISEYRSTRLKRHLANAVKYSLAFPVILASLSKYQMQEYYISNPNDSAQDNLQLIITIWIAFYSINSVFSLYWDIFMDWDLTFDLRSELYFDPKFYYFAIIFNSLTRFAWLSRIGLARKSISRILRGNPVNDLEELDKLLVLVEIARRSIWTLIRIEKEATSVKYERMELFNTQNL